MGLNYGSTGPIRDPLIPCDAFSVRRMSVLDLNYCVFQSHNTGASFYVDEQQATFTTRPVATLEPTSLLRLSMILVALISQSET